VKLLLSEEEHDIAGAAGLCFADVTARVTAGADRSAELGIIGELGWLGTATGPPPHGLAPALVAEAAGRTLLPLPFAELGLAVPAALAAWPEGASLLEAVVAGRQAWSPAGVDLLVDGGRGSPPLRAALAAGGWVVSGSAHHVQAAVASTGYLAVAADEEGVSRLFAVAADNVEIEATPNADETCPVSTVTFDGAAGRELPRASVDALSRWGAVGSVAELLGCVEAQRDLAVAYAKERKQFGVPIGSFQAVKHHCAEMHVLVEALRVAVWAAAIHAVEQEESIDHVAVAKSYAGKAGMQVGKLALQVHGGIGFTWEHPLHRFLKRTTRLTSAFGDAGWHRESLARCHLDGLSMP
jgi:alkylation response protein AidB-like acyl-CoA dehydrogenase